ncbi:MAG TPA: hypothetical protein VJC14_00075 [Candidatus Paceibacterota bacterium]
MEFTEILQYVKTPVTVAHVLAVVLGMGAALTSDILFSFFSKDKELNATEISTLSILAKIVSYGLILIALSGIIIFLSSPEYYLNSAKFLAKMSILLVLIFNGYVLNKYIWPHLLNKDFFTSEKERGTRRLAFVCGAISVVSWLSVCTLGVLNSLNMAYGLIMGIYLSIICFGSIVALLVERKELN